jgi:malate dehydrogenase (oxaloacetate-decarboxylating)
MLLAAARALAESSPALRSPSAPLLPALVDIRPVAAEIAVAVGLEAQRAGLAPKMEEEALRHVVAATQWTPVYPSFTAPDRTPGGDSSASPGFSGTGGGR